MRANYKGKYTRMSQSDPQAVGRCDYSGFIVAHRDLRKQMEYRGRGLVWTGLWVHKKFLDVPNKCNLIPFVGMDPVPIHHPRPSDFLNPSYIPTVTIPLEDNVTRILKINELGEIQIQFTGDLTAPVSVLFPDVIGNWTIFNYTQGGHLITLGSLVSNNPSFDVAHNTSFDLYATYGQISAKPFLT